MLTLTLRPKFPVPNRNLSTHQAHQKESNNTRTENESSRDMEDLVREGILSIDPLEVRWYPEREVCTREGVLLPSGIDSS
jgi:hypothetical protein